MNFATAHQRVLQTFSGSTCPNPPSNPQDFSYRSTAAVEWVTLSINQGLTYLLASADALADGHR
ncbi:hypothetical protein [Nocardia rhamnosiphila]|uniref:Uncharacterized protein n=1 Tax=Nocardia rhamnosiphila TaxID=426716 RepID=A0ABV2WZ21_9NOCA